MTHEFIDTKVISMNLNPFKKEDKGISFIIIILASIGIQVAYVLFYVIKPHKNWIPVGFFYLFSFLFSISYYKLLSTDVSLPADNNETLAKNCKYCRATSRRDVYHCWQCKVCTELHDHHCDYLAVCVCAKNYKYFILTMAYFALETLAFSLSMLFIEKSLVRLILIALFGALTFFIGAIMFL